MGTHGGGGGRGGQGGKGTRARHGRRRAQETLRAGSRPQARGGEGGRGEGSGGQQRVVAIVLRHSISLLVSRRLSQDSQPAAAGLSWWEHTALAAVLCSWGTCSFGRHLAAIVTFFWGTASSLRGGGEGPGQDPRS